VAKPVQLVSATADRSSATTACIHIDIRLRRLLTFQKLDFPHLRIENFTAMPAFLRRWIY